MIVGVLRETKVCEQRVALTPGGLRALVGNGHQVLVEAGAGLGSGFPDAAYMAEGGDIARSSEEIIERCELILKVKEPTEEEARLLRDDSILFDYLHLAAAPGLADLLRESGATCLAYETVMEEDGSFPLLAPMSEIAGRLAAHTAAWAVQAPNGGPGLLLGGSPGVASGRVVVIGGGRVGENAARVAAGMGAEVIIYDSSAARLRELDQQFAGTSVGTRAPDPVDLEVDLSSADAIIGAVLVTGARPPHVLKRQHLKAMREATVLIDVSIDQGGCFETSRPTTHEDPVFELDGILHYCVANMPAAVPRTSTRALTNATLPYVRRLADGGLDGLASDPILQSGVNVQEGRFVHPAVASALATAAA